MFKRKKTYQGVFIFMIMLAPVLVPPGSQGQQVSLTPSIEISGRYDDNVAFSRNQKVEDYSSIIRPSAILEYATELSSLRALADIQVVNYIDETDRDNTKHNYRVTGATRISERLKIDADAGYIKDTLLDSELEETGRVFNQEERERYAAGGGLTFTMTQLSGIKLDYEFRRTQYEDESRSDRDIQSIGLVYNRRFNEGLDTFSIGPSYRFRNSDNVEADDYRLTIGWSHKISEIGLIRIYAGARYTEQVRTARADSDNTSYVADLSYEKNLEITSYKLGYRRDVGYDANDDLVEIDRFYANMRYKITERFSFNLMGSLYFTRSDQISDEEDSRFLDISPSLDYNLTENHFLRLRYRFSQEYDDTLSDSTANRNQVLLSLIFRFPQKY